MCDAPCRVVTTVCKRRRREVFLTVARITVTILPVLLERSMEERMLEAGWSIRELAEQAGTTVRTIHYYISEGLLPPPSGATRSATYSDAHLARLRLIGPLRDEGLALASIRQRLAPL